MIQKLSHSTIYVLDQDAAKRFYVDTLGFEVRMDFEMGNGFRWLTVGPKSQPELEIILFKIGSNNIDAQKAQLLRDALEGGLLGGGVFQTADCHKTYEELKAKGVEFRFPPTERFYGVETMFKDNSGNWFSLTQPKQGN